MEAKKMDILVVMLVIGAALIGGIGQLLFKKGVAIIGQVTLWEMAKNFVIYIFTNPFIFFGLALYGISTIFYLAALSRGELSFIYPLISLSYVFVALLAFLFLGEKLSIARWLGIITIVAGVFLVVKS